MHQIAYDMFIFQFIVGFIQPSLLSKRLRKGDNDGLMDRHWVLLAERKETLYKEIGEKSQEEFNHMLIKIYEDHHITRNVVCNAIESKLCLCSVIRPT